MSKNSVTALGNVPKDVQQHVRDLLSITPSLRPDVHQMSKVGWLCKSKKESLQPVTLHIPLEVLISYTSNRNIRKENGSIHNKNLYDLRTSTAKSKNKLF